MKINIDISKANMSENKRYRGAGMISANNSSRLLIDYKAKHPDRYYELLEHIFGADGTGAVHFKLEMGSDINSSSGTEPCVMRYSDETADVTRGAGFQLAADIKQRYPWVTLDMLYWSEPAWVTAAEDVYAARYSWYKENLTAAYRTYGLKFDYVSVSRNERGFDPQWIKYIARRLKSETDCPYDFSAIKIVSADEENSWHIADAMADDEELRELIDVVGTHYTSHSTDNAKLMADSYGKEIWFSEGSAPMNYSEGCCRFDGSGLAGINGVLDIANRIIAMYPCGRMTLYEYQPAVSAYYDGVTFCHKQLITAAEPWSGYYSLDSGYYMSLHFSRFFRKGWCFIDEACHNDSKVGGDGHALVDTVYSFMTACNPKTGEYSTVIANSTDKPLTYEFSVPSDRSVNVWETRGPDSGSFDENYFRKTGSVTPQKSAEGYGFSVTVSPFSLTTVSTLDTGEAERSSYTSQLLELPYHEHFWYTEEFISSRGGAPFYTCDQGGAFEIQTENGKPFLMQMIIPETKAEEWGGTPLPMTSFGDDRWFNYSVSARVRLTRSDTPTENFIGAGLRCFLTCNGNNGYSLLIYENRHWALRRNGNEVLSGAAEFSPYDDNEITISAVGGTVTAYLNGMTVAEYSDPTVLSAGRAALYSSYDQNRFYSIDVLPAENVPYSIERYDDTDEVFTYTGEWEHQLMNGFVSYKRTLSVGKAGASAILSFEGTGFGLFGPNGEDTVVSLSIDGNTETIKLSTTGARELFLLREGLPHGNHTAELTVISGTLSLDGAQVTG